MQKTYVQVPVVTYDTFIKFHTGIVEVPNSIHETSPKKESITKTRTRRRTSPAILLHPPEEIANRSSSHPEKRKCLPPIKDVIAKISTEIPTEEQITIANTYPANLTFNCFNHNTEWKKQQYLPWDKSLATTRTVDDITALQK